MHEEVRRLFDLSGQTALVTGGARHLGYDAAAILAATARAGTRPRASRKTLPDPLR